MAGSHRLVALRRGRAVGDLQAADARPRGRAILLEHAFDTLGYRCVGFRTDRFNARSRRAIVLFEAAGWSPVIHDPRYVVSEGAHTGTG